MQGLSDEAISYIKSIQPYNRADGAPVSSDPLWCLHELNRIDKHRRISVTPGVYIAGRTIFGAGLSALTADLGSMSRERTDYGYDIVCTGPYKHLQPDITPFVQFGEQESGIVLQIQDIIEIHDLITNDMLPRLASFAKKNN